MTQRLRQSRVIHTEENMEDKEMNPRETLHRNMISRGSEAFMGSDEESWPHYLVNLPDQSKYSMASQPKANTGEHF